MAESGDYKMGMRVELHLLPLLCSIFRRADRIHAGMGHCHPTAGQASFTASSPQPDGALLAGGMTVCELWLRAARLRAAEPAVTYPPNVVYAP